MDREREGGWMGFMEMCGPMMSKIMGERPGFQFLFAIPGLLLVLGGVLTFTAPMVLVWLIAGTSIVIGILILSLPIFLRKMTARSKPHREVEGGRLVDRDREALRPSGAISNR